MNDYIVTSMYTPKYKHYAHDLKFDLERLGIPFHIERYEDTGSYVGNHLLKPKHIHKMVVEQGRNILWVDVDSRVHGKFDYLNNEFTGDVGAVMFENNACGTQSAREIIPYATMCTATMYLRSTEGVRSLIDEWVATLAPSGDAVSIIQYDWNLLFREKAEGYGVTFEKLPFEYCWVQSGDEEHNAEMEVISPIIEQFYANVVMRK